MWIALALAASAALFALACYCSAILPPRVARIRDILAGARPASGLLFFDQAPAEVERRIGQDRQLQAVFRWIEREADAMLAAPLPAAAAGETPTPEDAVRILRRIIYLSFVYLMKRDAAYLDRAVREMRAVSACRSWDPASHLATSALAAALAVGYNWLHAYLAPRDRALIRKALLRKGLYSIYLPIVGNWWKLDSYNHAQVGYGGLGLAAAALLRDYPARAARVLAICIGSLPKSLRANYGCNGEYREGPAYWAYGTTYTVLLIAALEDILGHSFGLERHGSFMQSPRYFLHCHGPSTLAANFSDCAAGLGPVEIMHWFARKLRDPSLAWFEGQKLDSQLPHSLPSVGDRNPFLPLLCLWKLPTQDLVPPGDGCRWPAGGKSDVAYLRSGWAKEDSFVALKGGSPSVRHGQMDAGSFLFETDGVRWGIDLGSVDYGLMKSRGIYLWGYHRHAQRWKVFRLNNFSHNTLTIEGRRQNPRGKARVLGHCSQGERQYAVMDLSELYAKDAKAVRRGVSLLEGNLGLLVQDEIAACGRPVTIRWAMATRASAEVIDDRNVLLKQEGKELRLEYLGEKACRWQVSPADPPPAPHDEPNPGTCMVGFTLALDRHERVGYTVCLRRSKRHPESIRTPSMSVRDAELERYPC